MKVITRFFVMVMALAPLGAWAAVPTTAGSNLTAYNPTNMGSVTNNNWNNLTNPRGGTSAPPADFGNCNALILRCAQPKCASGGCSSMDVAMPIVAGCVQSNDTCKKYGDDLTQYIAAQLVATSTARANEAAQAAASAAAQAQAAQSAQQMQQMQAQMQQMQTQMAQQNAAATQQLQAALEEQKQLTAQALAQAEASAAQAAAAAQAQQTTTQTASVSNSLTQAQVAAANAGVSADILVREQISGQIMSKIENATTAMKTLKATMESAFAYAGCDRTGNNCSGPRRVKMFKEKALPFFDDYNAVLSEIYGAIITAQAVGVDLTDIYLMLSGTCHVWGKYLCQNPNETNMKNCQLIQTLTDQDEVQQNWLWGQERDDKGQGGIRIGCVSDALNNSVLFRNMKKEASIDVQTLQRIIEQDAPNTLGSSRYMRNRSDEDIQREMTKYCGINDAGTRNSISDYDTLVQAVTLRKLPASKVCVTEAELDNAFVPFTPGTGRVANSSGGGDESAEFRPVTKKDICEGMGASYNAKTDSCRCSDLLTDDYAFERCIETLL